jgi:Ca-activated chloride channel family protein
MIWEDIHLLWLLLLIPILITGGWFGTKKLRAKREQYFGDKLFNNLYKHDFSIGKKLRSTGLLLGLFLLIAGAAGPKLGTEVREVKRSGVDVMIALDLSSSMNAEDVSPSRLEKAKYEITRLLERLKGDRVGLIVFTGEAYLQSPMTMDYSALRLFLNIVDTNQMPSTTTQLSSAMDVAIRAFEAIEEDSKASKVLLIISDGENQGEDYEKSQQNVIDNNIDIYTIGIGTTEGATIPMYSSDGDFLGYKRDKQGKVVTTNLQPDILRNIARKGNGEYYQIQRGNDGVDGFIQEIDQLEKGEFARQEYADYKNQYQWLVGIGAGFVAISLLIPTYRRKNNS